MNSKQVENQGRETNFYLFRFQRRNRRIQKHFLHRLGRRRTGQDPTSLETLLPEHAGTHFRRRLLRSRAYPRITR